MFVVFTAQQAIKTFSGVSSRVPAPLTSAEPIDKFLSHCSQISAGDHMQIIEDPIGAVEVKVLTSQAHTYKLGRV